MIAVRDRAAGVRAVQNYHDRIGRACLVRRHGDEAVEAYGHVAKAAVRGKAFLDHGRFAQIVFDGRGQIAHFGKIRL